MNTIFLAKETGEIPADVCHIYEHWFIMSFRKFANERLKIDTGFIGSISGENYKYLLFLEAYFYNDKVTKLFNEFVKNEVLYDDLLEVSLRQCAAEERISLGISDQADFNKYIELLKQAPWQDANKMALFVYEDDRPKHDQPLVMKKSAKSYKNVGIELCLENASLEEQALFLRLHLIIQDVAFAYLQGKGWYVQDDVGIRHPDNRMICALSLTLPRKDETNPNIKQALIKHFKELDIKLAMPYITANFEEFATNPFLVGHPRHTLHYSPVVAGNQVVASLATEVRIKRVFSSIKPIVFNMTFAEAKDLIY